MIREAVLGLAAAVGIYAIGDRVVRWLVAREMRDVARCVYLPLSQRVMCLRDGR